jgi:hypothetical protein
MRGCGELYGAMQQREFQRCESQFPCFCCAFYTLPGADKAVGNNFPQNPEKSQEPRLSARGGRAPASLPCLAFCFFRFGFVATVHMSLPSPMGALMGSVAQLQPSSFR